MQMEASFELIRRAQAGDSGALEELLERYRPRLQRWATGRLPQYARGLADTDDVVQDVLISAFRNIHSFECRDEWGLQAYLRQAVTNRLRTELRRRGGHLEREELSEDISAPQLSPLELVAGKETFERYERALTLLEPPEREAVIARLELGCSYHEIAMLVDKRTPDAARMLVTRALAKVASSMA